jgi:hypothetical protein
MWWENMKSVDIYSHFTTGAYFPEMQTGKTLAEQDIVSNG